jgi:FdhD protein
MSDAARPHDFAVIAADGAHGEARRAVAVETPVAIEVNGLGYAVLMATPADLTDLAYGFARAERLIARAEDVIDVDIHHGERGTILRLTLIEEGAARALDRVRHRVSESSCGLCGIENLEQALRPLPRLPAAPPIADGALFAALAAIRHHQPLSHATGAVHAAAMCEADGAIRMAREDVGRHNAFDKLIGAAMRAGDSWQERFALLTSRCSYELVEKAVLAGCPTLVTISAPTTLALDRAAEAGLRLVVLARTDSMLGA